MKKLGGVFISKFARKVISFLMGVFIFTVIPIIFWGVFDLEGYFSNLPRLIYSILMLFLTLFTVIFTPEEGRSRGEGEKTVTRQKVTIFFLQVFPILIIIISPIFDRYDFWVFEQQILRYLGLVFTFLGFSLMNWSVVILGKQFSVDVTIQKDHELIIEGPYKVIRHPRYLGIISLFLGISFVFRAWISVLLSLLTVIVLLWRISDEEKLMSEEFKERWGEYAKKTWRLIPFIY